MRVPGTFKQLWKQLEEAPTPVTSISIPTENGPLVLTFDPKKPEPTVETTPAVKKTPQKVELKALPRPKSDVVGAFQTPPAFREDPFTKREDI